jgi:hypothetical protein
MDQHEDHRPLGQQHDLACALLSGSYVGSRDRLSQPLLYGVLVLPCDSTRRMAAKVGKLDHNARKAAA